MRALNSSSPMGWGKGRKQKQKQNRNKSKEGLREKRETGGAVFLSGAAKGRCAAAEPPEAAF